MFFKNFVDIMERTLRPYLVSGNTYSPEGRSIIVSCQIFVNKMMIQLRSICFTYGLFSVIAVSHLLRGSCPIKRLVLSPSGKGFLQIPSGKGRTIFLFSCFSFCCYFCSLLFNRIAKSSHMQGEVSLWTPRSIRQGISPDKRWCKQSI